MKKTLLLIVAAFSILTTFAQPAGMLNETFRLKSLYIGNSYLTPNGENPGIIITDNAGSYYAQAGGIFNQLNAEATFAGNSLTLTVDSITLHDCVEPNCYYEDLYFYNILTTENLDSKTFTYYYSENNGFKFLRLKDANNNNAYYSTEPAPVPDPRLFQTWYLFMQEVDMGEPVFFTGPNPPQLTINTDFTYAGIESCATISGNLILGLGEYYDFVLQSRNYSNDESNCAPGEAEYAMWELTNTNILDALIYEGNDGNDYLMWEYAPGFLSHFSNVLLSTPENSQDHVRIFPNPVKHLLYVQSAVAGFDVVTISDINGRTIMSLPNLTSNQIDVSNLTAGLYFVTLTTAEGLVTKKFIKN